MKVRLLTLLLPASLIPILLLPPDIAAQEPGIKLGVGNAGVGVSIGLVNIAAELHGLQLGLVNIARNKESLSVLPLANYHP